MVPPWLRDQWGRFVNSVAMLAARLERVIQFLSAGLLAAWFVTQVVSEPNDVSYERPVQIGAGVLAAGLVGVFEAVLRRSDRLSAHGIGPWPIVLVASGLFAAAAALGVRNFGEPLPSVLLISLGLLIVGLSLAKAAESSLPLLGAALYVFPAALVVIGTIEEPVDGGLNGEQVAVIMAAALLVTVGFMVQEFGGSKGWYVLLVLGLAIAATLLTLGLGQADDDPLSSDWFLASCLAAMAIAFGLLAWRVLTWGWYAFGTAIGSALLLIAAPDAENNRIRVGVLVLVLAMVAGAASSLSKRSFRLVASLGLAVLGTLAIVEGSRVTDQGDDNRAAAARDRFDAQQIQVIGVNNCVSQITPIDGTGSEGDTAVDAEEGQGSTDDPGDGGASEAVVEQASSCLEEVGTERQPIAELFDGPSASQSRSVSEQFHRLRRELADLVCETTEERPAEEQEDEEVSPTSGPSANERRAALQCGRTGQLQIASNLDRLTVLGHAVELQKIERALIAQELLRRGGPRLAPQVTEAAETSAAALSELEDELRAATEESTSLRELLVIGADNAADKLLPGSNDDVRLGPYGWLVLALLVILGYRRAEIINNRRTSAPIVVETPVGSSTLSAADASHLRALMEAEISRAGIDEPAALPGSELVSEVVELIQGDSVQGSGIAAAVLTTLRNIGFPIGGITVRSVIGSQEGQSTITVSVHTSRSKTPLYAETFAATDLEAATRLAALYVARAALNYGRNVPRWARWHSEDGVGFRLFQEAVQRGSETNLDVRATHRKLLTALAASPATSQIRVELGHLEDLRRKPARSLRFHLEARVENPRLLIAGYRLATSASMLSAELPTHWFGEANADARRGIVDLLEEGGLLRQASRTPLWRRAGLGPVETQARRLREADPARGEVQIRQVLLCVAWSELQRIQYRLWVPAILAMATFQSERRYWLRFLRNPDHRRQTSEQFETVRLIVELRLVMADIDGSPGHDLPDAGQLAYARALARRVNAIIELSRVGSHALYNAACFHSLLSHYLDSQRPPLPDDAADDEEVAAWTKAQATWETTNAERATARATAIQLLHRSRRSGRGTYPAWRWIKIDPDLEPLKGDPAYDEIAGWLEKGNNGMVAANAADPVTTTAVPEGAPT